MPPTSYNSPRDSMAAALRLFRRSLAGEPLTPAERQQLAALLGQRDPSIRAMVTVTMADERAGHRLTALEIEAIAADTRAYAEALSSYARERAAREHDEVAAAALPRLAPEDLAVGGEPEPEAGASREVARKWDAWASPPAIRVWEPWSRDDALGPSSTSAPSPPFSSPLDPWSPP